MRWALVKVRANCLRPSAKISAVLCCFLQAKQKKSFGARKKEFGAPHAVPVLREKLLATKTQGLRPSSWRVVVAAVLAPVVNEATRMKRLSQNSIFASTLNTCYQIRRTSYMFVHKPTRLCYEANTSVGYGNMKIARSEVYRVGGDTRRNMKDHFRHLDRLRRELRWERLFLDFPAFIPPFIWALLLSAVRLRPERKGRCSCVGIDTVVKLFLTTVSREL